MITFQRHSILYGNFPLSSRHSRTHFTVELPRSETKKILLWAPFFVDWTNAFRMCGRNFTFSALLGVYLKNIQEQEIWKFHYIFELNDRNKQLSTKLTENQEERSEEEKLLLISVLSGDYHIDLKHHALQAQRFSPNL